MMKCVFALAVLLHFCCSYKLNVTLNREIISRLDTLSDLLQKKKVNITSPNKMRMPTSHMSTHASSCVSVFVNELKQLLDNVTVHKEEQHILHELDANLQTLDPHQQADPNCRMVQRKSLTPFETYSLFLRRLNESKKK